MRVLDVLLFGLGLAKKPIGGTSSYVGYMNPSAHIDEKNHRIWSIGIPGSAGSLTLREEWYEFLNRTTLIDGSLLFAHTFYSAARMRTPLIKMAGDFLPMHDDMMQEFNRADWDGPGGCDTTIPVDSLLWHGLLLAESGVPLSRRVINIGASDGKSEDPVYEYIHHFFASGVLVEPVEEKCEQIRATYHHGIEVICDFARSSLVEKISTAALAQPTSPAPPLGQHRVTDPEMIKGDGPMAEIVQSALRSVGEIKLDIVKIDIDSFDGPLLRSVLHHLRATDATPALIAVEINPIVPPPFSFHMHEPSDARLSFDLIFNGSKGDVSADWPLRGMSLSYAVELTSRFGYGLVAFGIHDAIFVRNDLLWVYQLPRRKRRVTFFEPVQDLDDPTYDADIPKEERNRLARERYQNWVDQGAPGIKLTNAEDVEDALMRTYAEDELEKRRAEEEASRAAYVREEELPEAVLEARYGPMAKPGHYPPFSEYTCYSAAFVSLNGLPLEIVRKWFYYHLGQLDAYTRQIIETLVAASLKVHPEAVAMLDFTLAPVR